MNTAIKDTIKNKITTLPKLKTRVEEWKAAGEKVVFTNGVFDLLHIGHITYMVDAASLGTKLIIGLNSDTSVKRLKGPERPVNDQDSRALLLATMLFIDAVVIFEEDTPLNLITTLMPDVLAKGGDYTVETIVGAEEVMANGGDVEVISFVDGFSSTAIIRKIRDVK
ncbi:D-glycero-beta-D-manno-heptose 1-phosphate adenylyltransferase [Mucilaginibacter myungsuensis]|uniref:D-glycero-beta-D-manno-heptose 1-phosphate adenylyltransferase n=1 Tax=Mucilaginibacter myungsuensis TaxID=649104 RepID=A0A929PW48_9SPHI|nr:D-glycero-beta-D-manno-heptose 1-phosphate adenylyltransferase [Mucilaginibacter myungsuensis]MBE9662448.1 D-glycero-beta-D-manno-heptose 1-phosphate adenylyltransferase [Mucilaginibacter myungsuensis]MDN3597868.1 D-glycero-beta-D-manno-heptose 1-phosphate adenylyltransferase [Mucilaginibacter myungsuensis]